jgi:predicted RNase H-like nuclease (RuvC/YqgF family)
MGRIPEEPVGPTCPQIDSMIDRLSTAALNLSDAVSEIENISKGKCSELEMLRDSNSSLRNWGRELYEILEETNEKIDLLETELEDSKNKIEELEKELKKYDT